MDDCNEIEYLKLCRLCLNKTNDTNEAQLSINDEEIKSQIQGALPDIELLDSCRLSQLVCQSCVDLIKKINDFRKTIRHNQEVLLKLLSDGPCFIKVEENFETLILNDETKNECQSLEKDIINKEQKKSTRKTIKSLEITKSIFVNNENVDDTLWKTDYLSDQDCFSDKSSLSEDDYLKKDSNDEEEKERDGKLALPVLQFEKGSDSVWCPFCFVKFKHKYFLASHGKIRHPEYNWYFRRPKSKKTRWECKFCDKTYTKRFRLKCHAAVEHFGKDPYRCDLCEYKTPLKNAIRNHIENTHLKIHNKRPKKQVECDICGNVCVSKDALKCHKQQHRNNGDRPFSCKKCNLFYRTEIALKCHNRKKHLNDDRPFNCTLCINACFITEEILQKHMERHKANESKKLRKPFECTACELRFGSLKLLQNHTKYHETNELTNCQTCGLTLHYTSLNEHVSIHQMNPEDYPYVCEICAKRFRLPDSLRNHIRVHDNPEYFECDKCHIRIKAKPSFSHHVKKCRGLNVEHICQYCGVKFEQRSTKYRHEMREHRGWRCKRCNVNFEKYGDLKRHRKTLEHKKTGKWGKWITSETENATKAEPEFLYY